MRKFSTNPTVTIVFKTPSKSVTLCIFINILHETAKLQKRFPCSFPTFIYHQILNTHMRKLSTNTAGMIVYI